MSLNEIERKATVEKSLDNAKRILAEIPTLLEKELYGNDTIVRNAVPVRYYAVSDHIHGADVVEIAE